MVIVPYCEGDDIISYLVLKNKEDFDCIIVSGDKDYLQLLQEGIYIYNWRTKVHYDEQRFIEEFKILPGNYIYQKCILGDASDLVEGVKGIGKKSFHIFYEILNKKVYENVSEFIDEVKKMPLDKLDTRNKNSVKNMCTTESIEKIFLLDRVMRLNEACVSLDHINIIRTQINEQTDKKLNRLQCLSIMQKHSFGKLYNGFDSNKWIQPFVHIKSNLEINI